MITLRPLYSYRSCLQTPGVIGLEALIHLMTAGKSDNWNRGFFTNHIFILDPQKPIRCLHALHALFIFALKSAALCLAKVSCASAVLRLAGTVGVEFFMGI